MNPFAFLFLLAISQPDTTVTVEKRIFYGMLDLVYCAAWNDAVEMEKQLFELRSHQMGDGKRELWSSMRDSVGLPTKCPRHSAMEDKP